MKMIIDSPSPQATHTIGMALGGLLRAIPAVVLLTGDLGAGKTALTKAMVEGMGITELVTSPTYTLVNAYGEEPLKCTYRIFNEEKGGYIWLYMQGAVMKEADGAKLCYVSYTDVTEERRNQKRLIHAKKRITTLKQKAETALKSYQTLMNTVPGGIALYEIDHGRVLTKYYNDGLCALSGYTREERDAICKEDAMALTYEEDVPALRRAMFRAAADKSDIHATYRIKTKSGTPRYISLNASYLPGKNKNPEFHAVFTDVDEMKRLEEAVNEQQLRYQVAIKSSGINIWEYNIQTDCLTVISNSTRIKQNCYIIENYVASTVEHDYVREDSLTAFYSIFERLKKGAKEVTEDIWYKTTAAAGWWCERVTYTTVFDGEGIPLKAFGAGKDVTREKEAVRKFKEEVNYRTAIQGNNLGAIKIDLTQNVIVEGESYFPVVNAWIKAGNADCYFEKNAELISTLQPEDDYVAHFNRKALINRFSGGEYMLSINFTRLLNEHQICWLKYNVHLAKNPENDHVMAFISTNDITDDQVMKMIMETVGKTDYEFFVVVDGSIDSASDYGSWQKERLFEPAQSFELRSEVLARRNVCPEDLERVVASCKIDNIMAHIQTGDVYKINYSRVDQRGERRRKQLQFTLIHQGRKTFLMTRIDVNEVFTQQAQAQKVLQTALERAESATRAKTDFLSRMSHDIRTPLNAVIGLSELGATSHSVEEMQNYYKQIETSGKYLLSIINDVLDMSRIEANTLVLHPTVVYLPTFIQDTLDIVKPMMEEKHIAIQIVQKGIAALYLRFDTTYLRQVVVNLLSNAVKFTPCGGHIELSLENISRRGNIVHNCMTVRDNGIGIGKEFLSKVFVPFEQENSQNDMTRKGTGLGLSIVKSIIDLMGGTIEVESEKGKGTAFIIHWDLEVAAPEEGAPKGEKPVEREGSLDGRRILLCEDHPLNTQIAKKLLEKKGVTVTHAENGQRALAAFKAAQEEDYDAILMDIRMPVMDGLAATRAIRKLDRRDAKTIPIIAMTANAFHEDREQSLNAGMNDHLAKPIEPEKLYRTLEHYMK